MILRDFPSKIDAESDSPLSLVRAGVEERIYGSATYQSIAALKTTNDISQVISLFEL